MAEIFDGREKLWDTQANQDLPIVDISLHVPISPSPLLGRWEKLDNLVAKRVCCAGARNHRSISYVGLSLVGVLSCWGKDFLRRQILITDLVPIGLTPSNTPDGRSRARHGITTTTHTSIRSQPDRHNRSYMWAGLSIGVEFVVK